MGCPIVDLTSLEVLQQSPNSQCELRPHRLALRKKNSTVSVAPSTPPPPTKADLEIAEFQQAMTSTPKSSSMHPDHGSPKSACGNLLPEDNYDPSTAILPLHSSNGSTDDEAEMLHRSNLFASSNDELKNVMQTEDSELDSSPVFGGHVNKDNTSEKVLLSKFILFN